MFLVHICDSALPRNARETINFDALNEALRFAYDYALDAIASKATFSIEVQYRTSGRTYVVYNNAMMR